MTNYQGTHKTTKKLVSEADVALFVLVEVTNLVDELVELKVVAAVVEADTVAGVDEVLDDAAVPGTHWSMTVNENLALRQYSWYCTYSNMHSPTGSTILMHMHSLK